MAILYSCMVSSQDRQRNDDNRSSGYGGFINKGGYRSMEVQDATTRGHQESSGAIDWNAAVSFGTVFI